MGTHPIFESDFDCLTDLNMSSKEEIVQGFQQMCQMQRQLHQKLAEIKQEREHELVADSLRKAEPERKAWRLVGGVLTERTVGEVLPALEKQIENLSTVIKTLDEQMEAKAKEITAYREKHQILVQGQAKAGPPGGSGGNRAGVLAQK